MIHAITTGSVRITQKWLQGDGQGIKRLLNTILDKQYSEWLPIWCFVIEHEEGLIVIDTGISDNANDPVYFPPYMPLVQRAAKFKISKEQELGNQMRQRGLNPDDVRYVILTHLHQDHDGGLHHFPNAEFIVSEDEWQVAKGLVGRMGGYLNQRWFKGFKPRAIQFTDGAVGNFPTSYQLLPDISLVPTYGHSAGHLSVIYHHSDKPVVFSGDMAYSELALNNTVLDGVTEDLDVATQSMERMRDFVTTNNAIFLPSHDPQSAERLATLLDERHVSLA